MHAVHEREKWRGGLQRRHDMEQFDWNSFELYVEEMKARESFF
jgi:hypothetical protein